VVHLELRVLLRVFEPVRRVSILKRRVRVRVSVSVRMRVRVRVRVRMRVKQAPSGALGILRCR